MSDPDLFQELRRALSEQSFGIESYEIRSSPFEHASIKLLDGPTILVKVSPRGWEILEPAASPAQGLVVSQGPRFETLDDLLRAKSPTYHEKEAKKLEMKLYEHLAKQFGAA